ncbi:MAG: cell wall-active antibiotics response protein LiaF [candidate division KSB1 bacterium]|nr:cell wall-active antibiotics response protein LiaF [candidate division KSB1 bacterium]
MSSNPVASRRIIWGGLLILLGVLFLLDNLEVIDVGDLISRYWPLILVAIGLKMILAPKIGDNPVTVSQGEASWGAITTDYLSENRFIGDVNVQVASQAFQGGTVSNFIGDITLDLSGIALAEGERNLTISGFIGDVTLVAPKNVAYAITASVAIGDLFMFGKKEDGLGVKRTHKSAEFDSSITRLNIYISFFIGDIKVF